MPSYYVTIDMSLTADELAAIAREAAAISQDKLYRSDWTEGDAEHRKELTYRPKHLAHLKRVERTEAFEKAINALRTVPKGKRVDDLEYITLAPLDREKGRFYISFEDPALIRMNKAKSLPGVISIKKTTPSPLINRKTPASYQVLVQAKVEGAPQGPNKIFSDQHGDGLLSHKVNVSSDLAGQIDFKYVQGVLTSFNKASAEKWQQLGATFDAAASDTTRLVYTVPDLKAAGEAMQMLADYPAVKGMIVEQGFLKLRPAA